MGIVGAGKEQTEVCQASADPVWQDVMEFDIETGNEVPKIQVKHKNTGISFGGDPIVGEHIIDLEFLRDQFKKDDWFPLTNPKGEEVGKIYLSMHWIWSHT
jgi:hypothetical protein